MIIQHDGKWYLECPAEDSVIAKVGSAVWEGDDNAFFHYDGGCLLPESLRDMDATFFKLLPMPGEGEWDVFYGRDAEGRLMTVDASWWHDGQWFKVGCVYQWKANSLYALPKPVQPEVPEGYRWQEVGEVVDPKAELLVRGEWVGAWSEVFGSEITEPYVFRIPLPSQPPVGVTDQYLRDAFGLPSRCVKGQAIGWDYFAGHLKVLLHRDDFDPQEDCLQLIIVPDDGTWNAVRVETGAVVGARKAKADRESGNVTPTEVALSECLEDVEDSNDEQPSACTCRRCKTPTPTEFEQDRQRRLAEASTENEFNPKCGVKQVQRHHVTPWLKIIYLPETLEEGTEVEWRKRNEIWPTEVEGYCASMAKPPTGALKIEIGNIHHDIRPGDKVYIRRAQ